MKSLVFLLLLAIGSHNSLAQSEKPTINADEMQLLLQGKVLLDAMKDGFMRVLEVRPAPNGRYFLVIACGFECFDNIGFLFKADGTGKRVITPRASYILQNKAEWSADSQYLYYFRINSTAADLPHHPPPEEWKQVHVVTGVSTVAATRRLKPQANYAVFRLWNDMLNVRAAPNAKAAILGKIPSAGKGIRAVGETKQVGKTTWAKIRFGDLTGWVNQSYLCEEVQP